MVEEDELNAESEEDDDDANNNSDNEADEDPEEEVCGNVSIVGLDDDDDGNQSRVSYVSERLEQLNALDVEELQALTREQLAEVAKDRVRRQLEAQRRQSRHQGAFRRRNTNKSYAKGKRVLTDTLL